MRPNPSSKDGRDNPVNDTAQGTLASTAFGTSCGWAILLSIATTGVGRSP